MRQADAPRGLRSAEFFETIQFLICRLGAVFAHGPFLRWCASPEVGGKLVSVLGQRLSRLRNQAATRASADDLRRLTKLDAPGKSAISAGVGFSVMTASSSDISFSSA